MEADFNHALGFEAQADGTLVLDPGSRHRVAPDLIHFAVLTTMAEVAAARAVGDAVVPTTVTVHLMRPAREERLVARGSVLRKGRRLCVAEGEVLQGDHLVAKAVVQFAVVGNRG